MLRHTITTIATFFLHLLEVGKRIFGLDPIRPSKSLQLKFGNRFSRLETLETRVMLSTTAPVIFNISESVAPGQVLAIQGDNFGTNPQVWVDRIENGSDTPNTETQLTNLLNKSDDMINVVLPESATPGLYAVFIKNGSVTSAPKFINQADPWQFLDLAGQEITSNFNFRIYGMNLDDPGATSTVRFKDNSTQQFLDATVTQGDDPYVLQVTAPNNLVTGRSYTVYVSNGFGGTTYGEVAGPALTAIAGGTDHFGIGTPWAASKFGFYSNVYNVKTDSRLSIKAIGNGVSGDAAAIQGAIDAANAAGGGVVFLPSGTYNLRGVSISMKSNVVLQGEGKDANGNHQSIIYDNQSAYNSRMVVGTASRFGFADLQFESGPQGFGESIMVNPAGPDNGYAFYLGVKVIQPRKAILQYGVNKTVVMDSEFIHTSLTEGKYVLEWYRNDILIKNTYFQWADGRMLTGDSRWQVEGNVFSRSIYTNITGGANGSNGTGFGGPSQHGDNFVFLNNTFDRLETATEISIPQANDGETILNEHPNYVTTGKVSSATNTTLVGLTPFQTTTTNWPTNYFAGYKLSIVDGPGMGQTRTITSNTNDTITINAAWDVNPTSASWFTVSEKLDSNYLIKGNLLQEVPRGIWLGYTSSMENVAIVGNTLIDAEAIHFRADIRPGLTGGVQSTYERARFPVIKNVYIQDNTLTNTKNWYPAKISLQTIRLAQGGIPIYGNPYYITMVRDNTINSYHPNNREVFQGVYGEGFFAQAGQEGNSSLGIVFDGNTANGLDEAYHINGANQVVIWNSSNPGTQTQVLGSSPNQFVGVDSNTSMPYVWVVATDATASEAGSSTGTYTFYRNGTSGDLTVNYFMDGPATNGVDYNTLSGSITILDGQSTATLTLTPIDDAKADEGPEGARLNLLTSANYIPAYPTMAEIKITDDDYGLNILRADFNGKGLGTGTGGADDLVSVGGTGVLATPGTQGPGSNWNSGSNGGYVYADPGMGGGSFLRSNVSGSFSGGPTPLAVTITPNSAANSWAALTTKPGSHWLMDGGFDFFFRNNEGNFASYPLAFSNKAAGGWDVQLELRGGSSNFMKLSMTPPNGAAFSQSASVNLTQGQIYHIGVTFNTNPSTGMVTVRYFVRQGTGAIDTTSSTHQIGSDFTFNPNETYVSTTFPSGAFNFGENPALGASNLGGAGMNRQNDFDKFSLWSADPSVFPSLAGGQVVSIVATDPNASETGPDSGMFTITRSEIAGAVTIYYAVGGTASTNDYTQSLSGSVLLADGQASTTITITPVNDATAEGDETVQLTLLANAAYILGSPSSDIVTIADDDVPTVTLSATDSIASETGPDNGTFTVTRTDTSGDITVNYVVSGTASNGTDYTSLSGSVVIPNGQSSVTITVSPIDDNLFEGDESVILTLASGPAYSIGSQKSGTVTITDNDNPLVTISAPDSYALETGDPGKFVVTRSGGTEALTVNYAIGGTATNGSDYVTLSGSVTIASGESSATIDLSPLQDAAAEGQESVMLTLIAGVGYDVGSPSSATVVIFDDETATVNDQFTDGDRTNGSDLLDIQWYSNEIFSGSSTSLTVVNDPNLSGNSLSLNNPTVSFPTFVERAVVGRFDNNPITLSNVGDSIHLALDFRFTNALQSHSENRFRFGLYSSNGTPSTSDSTSATRNDDGYWAQTGYGSVAGNTGIIREEGDGTSLMMRGSDISQVGAAEAYAINDNLKHTGILEITRTNTNELTIRMIITDAVGNELINLVRTESNPVTFTFDQIVLGMNANELDFNVDNVLVGAGTSTPPNETVTIQATDPIATELGETTGTYTVTRLYNTGDLTVNYIVSGSSTATSGSDYEALSGSVVIPDGQTTATITLTPIDDAVSEGTETVVLTLASGTGYEIGPQNTATVSIVDDEVVEVSIVATNPIASEDGPSEGAFTITRSSASGAITINYTVEGTSTATNGTDYTTLSGSVTMADQQSSATITVSPIDDSDTEGNETVVLSLASGSGYTINSAANTATVTILDNDLTSVTISATDVEASEAGSDTATFTVTRTNTNGALTVYYDVAGTAPNNGSDYITLTGSVTIADGQSTSTITITPIDDSLVEGAETVTITLTAHSGYVVGSQSSATIIINDNDSVSGSGVVQNGLKGHWQFEESGNTIIDASGSGLNGTLINGTHTSTPLGQGLRLNPTNPMPDPFAHVNLGDNLDLTPSGITISAWVKPIAVNNLYMIVAKQAADVHTNRNYYLAINQGKVRGHIAGDQNPTGGYTVGFKSTQGSTTLSTNQWYYLTMTWSGNATEAIKVYVNGVLETGVDDTTNSDPIYELHDSSAPLRIGARGNASGGFEAPYRGDIDEVTIYNRPLSASEIVQNYQYNGQPSGTTQPSVIINATDPIAMEAGQNTGTFTVTRTGSTSGNLVVNYLLSGSSINGSDYTTIPSSGSVTILDGQTSASITVIPIDDTISEPSETVVATITNGSGYTIGIINTATVTILDNDPSTVTIAATKSYALESGGQGQFVISRTSGAGAMVVNYTISGTAINGIDYSIISNSVTLADGVLSAPITVAPILDALQEGTETVTITLGGGTNYFVGTQNSATVRILDDDTEVVNDPFTDGGQTNGNDPLDIQWYSNEVASGASTTLSVAGDANLTGNALKLDNPTVAYPTYVNRIVVGRFDSNPITLTNIGDSIYLAFDFRFTSTLTNNSENRFRFGLYTSNGTPATANGTSETRNDDGYWAQTGYGGVNGTTGIFREEGDGASLMALGSDFAAIGTTTSDTINDNAKHTALLEIIRTGANELTIRQVITDDSGNELINQVQVDSNPVTYTFDEIILGMNANELDYNVDNVIVGRGTVSGTITETVTIQATDPIATEAGETTGTFTVTRLGASGDLTINYSVTGTALDGIDYDTIGTSVTIYDGYSSATIAVTPIDDTNVEGAETAIVTLTSGTGYAIGAQSSATVTILDDDVTEVTIVATDDAASEEGSDTGTFTVTRSDTSGDLTVNYTVSGSATNGSDFNSLSGSVVIPSGQSTATLTVIPIDDSDIEFNEDVTITLASGTGYTIGGSDNATVTIADNDLPLITIVATDAIAAEAGLDTGLFVVTRSGTGPAATYGDLIVNYTLTGTASEGSDYTATDPATGSALIGSVTILDGQSAATFRITPIDDTTNEGNETVIATLAGGTGYSVGTPSSDTVVIVDNDGDIVNDTFTDGGRTNGSDALDLAWYSNQVLSGSATTLSVVTDGSLNGNTLYANNPTVTPNVFIQRAVVGDFSDRPVTLVNVGDSLFLKFDFRFVNTLTSTGENRFKFGLYNSRGTAATGDVTNATRNDGGYWAQTAYGATAGTTGIFREDGDGSSTLMWSGTWAGESGTADVTQLSSASNKINDNNKHTAILDISRTSDTELTLVMTILDASGNVEMTYTAIDSNAVTFIFDQVALGMYTNELDFRIDNLVVSTDATPTLETVTIAATDNTATEASQTTGTFTVSRLGTNGNLTVDYTISGNASNGIDYSFLSGSVVIPDGYSSANITVTPIDDSLFEGAETVTLTVVDGTGYVADLTQSSDTVTIIDDDSMVVSIAATDATATETGPTSGTFTVTRTGGTTDDLTVNYSVSGTATDGTDYAALSGTVTILDGQSTATITITPIDDSDIEGAETVIVTLSNGGGYTVNESAKSDTVTITDDDLPEITITATDNSAAESGSATGTFTVTRTGTGSALTSGNLTVDYTVTGTATNGTDYTTLSGSVVIPDGQASAIITVTPIDDAVDEGPETVVVGLAVGTGYIVGSPSSGTVTIVDNDAATIIAQDTFDDGSRTEGNDPADIVWYSNQVLSGSATTLSVITDGSLDGNALNANNPTVGNPTYVQRAVVGDFSNRAITLSNVGDNAYLKFDFRFVNALTSSTENRFKFGLYNSNGTSASSDATNATRNDDGYWAQTAYGATAGTTGIFREDGDGTSTLMWSGKWIGESGTTDVSQLSSASNKINDNLKHTAILEITRTNTNELTLVMTILDASGTQEMSYTAVDTNAVTFTFDQVTLGGYTNELDYNVDNLIVGTGTIAELDTVTIVATDPTATETGPTTGTFTVSRLGTSGNLSVNYTVAGTATNGTDYTTLSGSVVIADGTSSATITVTPIDDSLAEGAETVTLTLASGVGYKMGSSISDTVEIAASDLVEVTIAASDNTATEAGLTTGAFTITRSGSTTGNLTVGYTVTGSATHGTDYTALSGIATILDGHSSVTVTVTPIDDSTQEGTETVQLVLTSGIDYTVGSPGSAIVSIVDDDLYMIHETFTDGDYSDGADAADIDWYVGDTPGGTLTSLSVVSDSTLGGGNALDANNYSTGSAVGRFILGEFADHPITLSNVGESVYLKFDFRFTNAFSDNLSHFFRFGLYNSDGTTVSSNDSQSSRNDDGFFGQVVFGGTAGTNRIYQEIGSGANPVFTGTGNTALGSYVTDSIDDNAKHTSILLITRTNTNELALSMSVLDANGNVEISIANAVASSPSTFTFDEVVIGTFNSELDYRIDNLIVGSGNPFAPDNGLGSQSIEMPPSADFDGDGFVTGRDFLMWQRGFGKSAPDALKTDGDANNDQKVDGNDLLLWQEQYGQATTLLPASLVSPDESHIPDTSFEVVKSAISLAQLVDAALDQERTAYTNYKGETQPIYDFDWMRETNVSTKTLDYGLPRKSDFSEDDTISFTDKESPDGDERWLTEIQLEKVFG